MKPLSIEELKKLKQFDSLFLVDYQNEVIGYFLIEENIISENEHSIIMISDKDKSDDEIKIRNIIEDYGTKWLAYKNKEQAECKGTLIGLPCELGATIYCIEKKCRDFFNDFDDNEDNWCEYYEPQGYYQEEQCNLVNKDCCSFNLEIYCEECKNKLKIEETKFRLELRDKIYGTDYYNKYLSLSNTYFLTKEQAEEKLKELRGEV